MIFLVSLKMYEWWIPPLCRCVCGKENDWSNRVRELQNFLQWINKHRRQITHFPTNASATGTIYFLCTLIFFPHRRRNCQIPHFQEIHAVVGLLTMREFYPFSKFHFFKEEGLSVLLLSVSFHIFLVLCDHG